MQYVRSMVNTSLLVYIISSCVLACDDQDTPPPYPNGGSEGQAGLDVPLAGAMSGTNAESMAGESAGSTAGEIAGSMAGETAESMAGETAGSLAGEVMTDGWGSVRSCSVTINYQNSSANRVELAGSFTSWGENALEMTKQGDQFTITLSAADYAELSPGERYPYKIIVDGQWILDPNNQQQQFDGACVNSAFVIPLCNRPSVTIEQLDSRWHNESGQAEGTLLVSTSPNAQMIDQINLQLDEEELSYEIDPSTGQLSFTTEGLSLGKHWLSVEVIDNLGQSSGIKRASFWIESQDFDWRDTPMYMLLVDRFANGDRSNDAPIGDPVGYSADWHGGDLQGALRALEDGYFERLGVQAIWLSPINLQVDGHFPDRIGAGRRFSAYHGYWPISGRQIDPRYGGDEGLRAFIAAAHSRGIRVLLDLINNQIHEQHEYYQQNPEWFRTGCVCGNDPGCGWSERPLDCLFASYLPDINWRIPGAEQQFIEDALYWVEEFDVDGFRVDAVKHVETTSIYNLRSALAQRFEGDGQGVRVWMFGETAVGEGDYFNDGCGVQFDDGYQWIDAYTGPYSLDGQFDFPTHHRLKGRILNDSGSYWDVDNAINDAQTRYQPEALHVRFLGSHDSTRVASEAAQDSQLGCRYNDEVGCEVLSTISSDLDVYQRLQRAWLLLWTTPGTPLLYYGDEIALAGGNDPDSRRDMPWADTLSDLAMSAPDTVPATISTQQEALRTWLSDLAQLRSDYRTLTRGDWQTIWVWDDVYVYTRYGENHIGQAELSVIAMSKSPMDNRIDIPIPDFLRSALTASRPLGLEPNLGQGQLLSSQDQSQFTLDIPAGAASVWVWSAQ